MKAKDYIEERFDTDFSITMSSSDLEDKLIEFANIKVKEARSKDEEDMMYIFRKANMKEAEIATANFYLIRNPNN